MMQIKQTQIQVHRDVLANGLIVVTVPVPHLHTASIVMYASGNPLAMSTSPAAVDPWK